MKKYYKNPALQEAIFEARFSKLSDFGLTAPGQFYHAVREEYPLSQAAHDSVFKFGFFGDDSQLTQAHKELIQKPVIQAIKRDGSGLLQAGPGIAVANMLKYTKWNDFALDIQKLLDAYLGITTPEKLTRINVRYINCFIIQEPKIRVTDYFNIGIQFPQIQTSMDAFDWSFVNSSNESDYKIKTRLLSDYMPRGQTVNKLFLDFDCFINLDENNPQTENVIKLADKAHKIISDSFESIITDATRDLMGGCI